MEPDLTPPLPLPIPSPSERPQICLVETRLRYPPKSFVVPLGRAEFAAAVLHHLIGHADREQMIALYLDARHHITHAHRVSVGSVTSAPVHPREVFKGACLANAVAIIIGHNHPSGDVAPSLDDRRMTDRLAQAGEVLGIGLLDSIIVGPCKEYHSIASGPGLVPERLVAHAARRLRS